MTTAQVGFPPSPEGCGARPHMWSYIYDKEVGWRGRYENENEIIALATPKEEAQKMLTSPPGYFSGKAEDCGGGSSTSGGWGCVLAAIIIASNVN